MCVNVTARPDLHRDFALDHAGEPRTFNYFNFGALPNILHYITLHMPTHALHPGHLLATLSKLLTYCVLRPTQPPTLTGTGNE